MEETITIKFQGKKVTVSQGLSILELIESKNITTKVVAASVDNELCSLHHKLTKPSVVELLDMTTEMGMRIYRDSLVFVLARAAKDVLPGCNVKVEHSLSNGLYGEISANRPLVEDDVAKIEKRMLEIVLADQPFEREVLSVKEASDVFAKQELSDKVEALRYYTEDQLIVHKCGDYYDTINDVFVPSTGYLVLFKLRFYLPGFILEYPKINDPLNIPQYVEHGKLAQVYYDTEKWGINVGVSDAASLNEVVVGGRAPDLIRLAEASQEKRIAQIADEISANRDRLRVILIAGPSSSGKTTFAQRLSLQLRINNLHPVAIGLDDYFVDREQTPLDEDGNYDFEALEAIDVKMFNEHLSKLIQGEPVSLPSYNFIEGQREWRNNVLQVDIGQPIIIEGIHGLNDGLTTAIPKGRKYKIYVSALTQLNVDDHTRIPTTDVRLLRRMIRDNQFRSHTAVETINRWPSVRRGEERHIFPFQEDADVMFNSALDYELAILKKYAEPLLVKITKDDSAYMEAQRLLRLLKFIQPLDVESEGDIPRNSIMREFIGGSAFA